MSNATLQPCGSVQSHAHGAGREMQKRPWYIEQLGQQIDRISKWPDRGGQMHRQRAQIHWWINNTARVNRHKFTAQEQRNSLSNRFPGNGHTRFSFVSFRVCSFLYFFSHSSLSWHCVYSIFPSCLSVPSSSFSPLWMEMQFILLASCVAFTYLLRLSNLSLFFHPIRVLMHLSPSILSPFDTVPLRDPCLSTLMFTILHHSVLSVLSLRDLSCFIYTLSSSFPSLFCTIMSVGLYCGI